jgi:uncharacterized protein
MISSQLLEAIRAGYGLDWHGLHGIRHWARVYENGLRLAAENGARPAVVRFFAVFHDSRRLSEGKDEAHGPRGARLAEEFRGRYFDLPDEDFSLLVKACRLHTVAATDDDLTVRTCFDADRLDLPRVGKIIDPQLLCTDAARRPEIIAWARARSEGDTSADILSVWQP